MGLESVLLAKNLVSSNFKTPALATVELLEKGIDHGPQLGNSATRPRKPAVPGEGSEK